MGFALDPNRNVPRAEPWGAMDSLGWLPEQMPAINCLGRHSKDYGYGALIVTGSNDHGGTWRETGERASNFLSGSQAQTQKLFVPSTLTAKK